MDSDYSKYDNFVYYVPIQTKVSFTLFKVFWWKSISEDFSFLAHLRRAWWWFDFNQVTGIKKTNFEILKKKHSLYSTRDKVYISLFIFKTFFLVHTIFSKLINMNKVATFWKRNNQHTFPIKKFCNFSLLNGVHQYCTNIETNFRCHST